MLSFAQKGVLLALDEAERRVKAGAAAQDASLAVARAEVIERDIELPLARAVLKARVGDVVRFQSPAGMREIEITDVQYL